MRATVIGCGVSGLTTAVSLRRAGIDAHIVARELPADTVSYVAGAIWGPTTVEPQDRTRAWALRSREVFTELAANDATGVAPMVHVDLKREPIARTWGEDTPYVDRLHGEDVPPGYATALRVRGLRIDPPIYLQWLMDTFRTEGGSIILAAVDRLEQCEGDAIVNCSGLGSRQLADDQTMYPIRGQSVAVANPGLDSGITDESDQGRIAYIYLRSTELFLGGTRDPDNLDPEPDPTIRERILADTSLLEPRLAGLPVITERVGFRPGRPEVRLEAEPSTDGRVVIHNYGHAGAGFIMSWGCAEEVVRIATGAGE